MKESTTNVALTAGGLVATAGGWVYRDYHSWLALGAGGLPSNFAGWMKTTELRFMMRNPFNLAQTRTMQGKGGDISTLTLPPWASARPRVDPHPVPHRQMTERPDEKARKALQAVFDEAVVRNSPKVRWALSHFEKHIQAITCSAPTS